MDFAAEPPDFDPWDDRAEVPRDFHSEYLSAPFVHCIDCGCEVQSTGEAYSVVKSYVGRETVFEMAICARCSLRLAESYSSHSKAVIEAAIREWQPPQQHDAGSSPAPGLAAGRTESLRHCAACGRERSACHRYCIVGAFIGRSLVTPTDQALCFPLLLCDRCNSSATENISRQTRDNWDRFVEQHFDGPPGIEVDGPRVEPMLI